MVLLAPEDVVDHGCMGADVQQHPVLPARQAVHGQAAVVAQRPGQALWEEQLLALSNGNKTRGKKKKNPPKSSWGDRTELGRSPQWQVARGGTTDALLPSHTHEGVTAALLVPLEEQTRPGHPQQAGRAIVPVALPAPLLLLLLSVTPMRAGDGPCGVRLCWGGFGGSL